MAQRGELGRRFDGRASGETRIVRAALGWGTLATLVAAGALLPFRGSRGSVSVLIAAGIVLANAGAAAAISVVAGKLHKTGSMIVALPSFGIRMTAIAAAMVLLQNRPFVDEPVFAMTFGTMILMVIALEARSHMRTPWLALTFDTEAS